LLAIPVSCPRDAKMIDHFLKNVYIQADRREKVQTLYYRYLATAPDAPLTKPQFAAALERAGFAVGKDHHGLLMAGGLSLRPPKRWRAVDGVLVKCSG
jgi:hypothetical protein